MKLDSECRMTVYTGTAELHLTCRPMQRLGRRFLAILSASAPIGAVVKLDCGDALVFGEIWACWSNSGAFHAVLQLSEMLSKHDEIAARSGLA
jgi:hypothetical protein